MKKVISFSLALLLIAAIFSGCSSSFDMDKSVNTLLNKGLIVNKTYTTEYQLKEATALFNAEVKFYGGNFTVEIKKAVVLEEPEEPGSHCQFVEFATEEQAAKYADLYATARKAGNEFKVAQSGAVVVVTNLELVMSTTGLTFK